MLALATAVRKIRRKLGLNQADFGELLNCSHSTVSQYETGKVTPSYYPLLKLFAYAQADQKQPILEAIREVAGLPATPTEKAMDEALEILQQASQSITSQEIHISPAKALRNMYFLRPMFG